MRLGRGACRNSPDPGHNVTRLPGDGERIDVVEKRVADVLRNDVPDVEVDQE